jgi:hypothetical protein
VIGGLDQVHRRNPAPGRSTAAAAGGAFEEVVEEPVHLVLDGVELCHRLAADKCHVYLHWLLDEDEMRSHDPQ